MTLIADGSDFLLPAELTFDVGAKDGTIRNIAVDILDDRVVEGTERFIISGSAAPLCPNQFVNDTSVFTIVDNDRKWGW